MNYLKLHSAKIFFLLIVLITFIPFYLAHYIYSHKDVWTQKTQNHGVLLKSAEIFNIRNLNLESKNVLYSKALNIYSWEPKKWHLIYLPKNLNLDNNAFQELELLQNLNIALGKNEPRVHRVIVLDSQIKNYVLPPTSQQKYNLQFIDPTIQRDLYKQFQISDNAPSLWIADPHGNIMLYYLGPFDNAKFQAVLADLRKLLSLSLIG